VKAEEVIVDARRSEPAEHPHLCSLVVFILRAVAAPWRDKHGRMTPARRRLVSFGLHFRPSPLACVMPPRAGQIAWPRSTVTRRGLCTEIELDQLTRGRAAGIGCGTAKHEHGIAPHDGRVRVSPWRRGLGLLHHTPFALHCAFELHLTCKQRVVELGKVGGTNGSERGGGRRGARRHRRTRHRRTGPAPRPTTRPCGSGVARAMLLRPALASAPLATYSSPAPYCC
jgi:hypothetical protein